MDKNTYANMSPRIGEYVPNFAFIKQNFKVGCPFLLSFC